jgi:hypothetical protein
MPDSVKAAINQQMDTIPVMTRTSHYESFTMRGTGYIRNDRQSTSKWTPSR